MENLESGSLVLQEETFQTPILSCATNGGMVIKDRLQSLWMILG